MTYLKCVYVNDDLPQVCVCEWWLTSSVCVCVFVNDDLPQVCVCELYIWMFPCLCVCVCDLFPACIQADWSGSASNYSETSIQIKHGRCFSVCSLNRKSSVNKQTHHVLIKDYLRTPKQRTFIAYTVHLDACLPVCLSVCLPDCLTASQTDTCSEGYTGL